MGNSIESVNSFLLGQSARPNHEFIQKLKLNGWIEGQFLYLDFSNRSIIAFDDKNEFFRFSRLSCKTKLNDLFGANDAGAFFEQFNSQTRFSDFSNFLNSMICGKIKKISSIMKKLRLLGWKEGQYIFFDNNFLFFDTMELLNKFLEKRTEKILSTCKITNSKIYCNID